MTAVDILFAAGWLTILGLFIRAVCRHLPNGKPKRTRADIEHDVAKYRAWRTTQLEQPLDGPLAELDAQLDQYAHTIRSLYTTEGDR